MMILDILGKKMDLSTLPKKPIQPNDLFEEVSIHEELFNYSKEIGITCFSTPFDETAVDFLESKASMLR